jgi:hypothetical protein
MKAGRPRALQRAITAEGPPWPRPLVLWLLPYGRIARDSLHLTSGWRCHPLRGDLEATRLAAPKSRAPGHVPHLVAHLVAHHVVPGPIRILPMILLYMILPHPFCSQWSCRPGHVPDERGPRQEPKLRRPYQRAQHPERQAGARCPRDPRPGRPWALPGPLG